MWKTTALQIGSNIQAPMVRSMGRPAAAAAVAPAITVERLGDLLGVFLFKVLRIGDRAYQEGLEGLPVVFDALADAAETANEVDFYKKSGKYPDGTPWISNTPDSYWSEYYSTKTP